MTSDWGPNSWGLLSITLVAHFGEWADGYRGVFKDLLYIPKEIVKIKI